MGRDYYGNYPCKNTQETPTETGSEPHWWEVWVIGTIFVCGILGLIFLAATS